MVAQALQQAALGRHQAGAAHAGILAGCVDAAIQGLSATGKLPAGLQSGRARRVAVQALQGHGQFKLALPVSGGDHVDAQMSSSETSRRAWPSLRRTRPLRSR